MKVAGEFGRHSLYKMLGYFSLVGLLRYELPFYLSIYTYLSIYLSINLSMYLFFNNSLFFSISVEMPILSFAQSFVVSPVLSIKRTTYALGMSMLPFYLSLPQPPVKLCIYQGFQSYFLFILSSITCLLNYLVSIYLSLRNANFIIFLPVY